jgi:hypothetical protein
MQVAVVARATGHRVACLDTLAARQAQDDRLSGQKAQPMGARGLQMQQQGIGPQRPQCAHGGRDLLARDVGRSTGFQRFQRHLAGGRRMRAGEDVALRFFRLGQWVIAVRGPSLPEVTRTLQMPQPS